MIKDKRSIDCDKEEAMEHVLFSAEYWAGDNIHSDASFNCPSNLGLKEAFKHAVEHVKRYHYKLSKKEIEELRARLFK